MGYFRYLVEQFGGSIYITGSDLTQGQLSFFPSNAVWLPSGRSTCFQACCMLD